MCTYINRLGINRGKKITTGVINSEHRKNK